MEEVKTNNKTEFTFVEFCEKKKTDYSEFFDLEMCDEKKTWTVVYHNNKNGYFPSDFKKNNRGRFAKNIEQKHLVHSIDLYCKEMGLCLEGFGNKVSGMGESIGWGSNSAGHLPQRLFPTFSLKIIGNRYFGSNKPYYGNSHYKKYIEDNNGECPLPLPKDVKWWEV
jgi:hypothetical protein